MTIQGEVSALVLGPHAKDDCHGEPGWVGVAIHLFRFAVLKLGREHSIKPRMNTDEHG